MRSRRASSRELFEGLLVVTGDSKTALALAFQNLVFLESSEPSSSDTADQRVWAQWRGTFLDCSRGFELGMGFVPLLGMKVQPR